MHAVLVVGGGKIGALIATLLAMANDFEVHIADINPKPHDLNLVITDGSLIHQVTLDATDQTALHHYVKEHGITTLISCLPYYCNKVVADTAKQLQLHYFDMTEDIQVGAYIAQLAQNANTVFVPQCGLAPGFMSIVATDLMNRFDQIHAVAMRAGALPAFPHNALKYALIWSTDGLINEYGNPCYGLEKGEEVLLQPLEGLETIVIDGIRYEAFNTSGGLGTLTHSYRHKVNTMNYKTLRYPGHCKQMRLLMNDLRLNEDRQMFKQILEKALPRTREDVVVIYVAVNGEQKGQFIEEIYVKKIYPQLISGKMWSAIQVATAASVCAVIDLMLKQPTSKGLILQESIPLVKFLSNRFGQYYQ